MKTKRKGKMRQSYKGDEEKEGQNVILKRRVYVYNTIFPKKAIKKTLVF